MSSVAQILDRIEDINKPRCGATFKPACGKLAEHAWFNHGTDEVVYRCSQHRITVFEDTEFEMLETIDTIEEAIAREVMDV